MVKSESDIIDTIHTGQVITDENGTQYFVCGKNRIKISEHFAAGGRPIGRWPTGRTDRTASPMATTIVARTGKAHANAPCTTSAMMCFTPMSSPVCNTGRRWYSTMKNSF